LTYNYVNITLQLLAENTEVLRIIANVKVAVHQRKRQTFNHDHVDIDGTYRWLRKSRAILQVSRDINCTNVLVWPLTVSKQLPQCDACNIVIVSSNTRVYYTE